MAVKYAWGRAWHGRSYDLGRMTLPELWAAYVTHPAIDVYVLLCVAAAAVALSTATRWESVAVPALLAVAVYPVAWYLIHRYILHGRWLYRMRWSAALWKRIHFDHHQDPDRLDVLFGSPGNTLPTIAAVTIPIGYAVAAVPGAASAFAAGLATTCVYEFVHCIQHLNYQPRSRLVRYLKQSHLLHHFHSELGNYGIVSFLPDRLLGTYYRDARACPRSTSVYNLGYDLEEARRYPWVMNATGAPPRGGPPSRGGPARPRAAAADSAVRPAS
jgi:sterol desaturase/sphingolipid hydroxylase (fatty acid hydroxylase superfamily)